MKELCFRAAQIQLWYRAHVRGFACAGCQYFSRIDHPFGASVAELCVMPVNSVDSERILVFKSPVNLGTGVPAPEKYILMNRDIAAN